MRSSWMKFLLYQFPGSKIYFRKEGIGLRFIMYPGELNKAAVGQPLSVDVSTADQEAFSDATMSRAASKEFTMYNPRNLLHTPYFW